MIRKVFSDAPARVDDYNKTKHLLLLLCQLGLVNPSSVYFHKHQNIQPDYMGEYLEFTVIELIDEV